MTRFPPNQRPARPQPDGPRRVQRGVKLAGKEAPAIETWVGRRWLRPIEDAAPPDRFAQGLEFARLGQTRDLRVEPGGVDAWVQDRAVRAHRARLAVPVLDAAQWEQVFESMAGQALYSAKLLAGELPVNIEDLFMPHGLRLFPVAGADLRPECDCGDAAPWCRHACCAACLAAERIDRDPFLVLTLRGMPRSELAERLRQRRAVAGATLAGAAAYTPRAVPGGESPAPPLEACLDEFWSLGPEVETVETALRAPEVSHALLRRLGPSPFEARFPLVGLLATCYDTISAAALGGGAGAGDQPGAPESAPDASPAGQARPD